MEKHEAEKIIETIRSLIKDGGPSSTSKRVEEATKKGMVIGKAGQVYAAEPADPLAAERFADGIVFDDVDKEKLYQQFKTRILTECPIDPVLLHLVTTRPEVRVEIEPRVIPMDNGTVKGKIAITIANGFFKEPREPKAIRVEIARTQGAEPHPARLSDALTGLVEDGILTREEGNLYQLAPGVKVTKTTVETTS